MSTAQRRKQRSRLTATAITLILLSGALAGCGVGGSPVTQVHPAQIASNTKADEPRVVAEGPHYFVVARPSRIRWISKGVAFTDGSGRTQTSPGFEILDRFGKPIKLPPMTQLHPMSSGTNESGGSDSGGGSSTNCGASSSYTGVVTGVVFSQGALIVHFHAPSSWGGAQYTVNWVEYAGSNGYQGTAGPFTYAASGTFANIDSAEEVDIYLTLNGPDGLTSPGASKTSIGGSC